MASTKTYTFTYQSNKSSPFLKLDSSYYNEHEFKQEKENKMENFIKWFYHKIF